MRDSVSAPVASQSSPITTRFVLHIKVPTLRVRTVHDVSLCSLIQNGTKRLFKMHFEMMTMQTALALQVISSAALKGKSYADFFFVNHLPCRVKLPNYFFREVMIILP